MDEHEFKADLPLADDSEEGKLTEEKMRESLENDLKAIDTRLEQLKKERKNYEDQFRLDCEIWDILQKPGNFKKVEPDYVFEQDEKYWELQARKQAFSIREDRAKGEGYLKGYDMQEKELKERRKSTEAKLKSLGKEEVMKDE